MSDHPTDRADTRNSHDRQYADHNNNAHAHTQANDDDTDRREVRVVHTLARAHAGDDDTDRRESRVAASPTSILLDSLLLLPVGSTERYVRVSVTSITQGGDGGVSLPLVHLQTAMTNVTHAPILSANVWMRLPYAVRDLAAGDWLRFERVASTDAAMWVCTRHDNDTVIKIHSDKLTIPHTTADIPVTPDECFE